MAGPLRGGGGKGPAIKEKRTFFWNFLKILLPFKNKKIFYFRQLIEIWTLREEPFFPASITYFFNFSFFFLVMHGQIGNNKLDILPWP